MMMMVTMGTIMPKTMTSISTARLFPVQKLMSRQPHSDGSSTLRRDHQPLARQRFVLFFDQTALALSDFVTLSRVGSEFVCAVIAPPALGEESIHGTSPESLGPWSLV